jgi:hypothetical protein
MGEMPGLKIEIRRILFLIIKRSYYFNNLAYLNYLKKIY